MLNAIKHENSNIGGAPGVGGIGISGFPIAEASFGVDKGTYQFESFETVPTVAASGTVNGLYCLIGAGSSTARQDKVGGVFDLAAINTETCALLTGNGQSGFCILDTTVSSRKRWFFEARLKTDDITATDLFVGVCAPQQTAVVTGADTLASIKLAGFHFHSNSVLETKVSDGSTTTDETITNSIANDTYVKLMVSFVEGPADSGELTFSLNGNKVAVYDDIDNSITESIANAELMGAVSLYGDGATATVSVDHLAYGYMGGDA